MKSPRNDRLATSKYRDDQGIIRAIPTSFEMRKSKKQHNFTKGETEVQKKTILTKGCDLTNKTGINQPARQGVVQD